VLRKVVIVLWLVPVTLLPAQEKSVNPGINKTYEHPDVADSIQRFEANGREVFDRRHEIVDALGLKPGMVVADVGAGTGLFTRLLSPAVGAAGKVYAVDIAQEFIEHIEKTAKSQDPKNIVGVVCKPDSVELPATSVDMVFLCDTYHHFEFPQKTMHSIYEALKPKGQVVLIDYRRIPGESSDWIIGHVRAGQEVFTQEIVDAGFKPVEEKKELLKEAYFLRFEKVAK
jgi:predicted methyltransferase